MRASPLDDELTRLILIRGVEVLFSCPGYDTPVLALVTRYPGESTCTPSWDLRPEIRNKSAVPFPSLRVTRLCAMAVGTVGDA